MAKTYTVTFTLTEAQFKKLQAGKVTLSQKELETVTVSKS